MSSPPSSREILHVGDEAVEALLAGTDAEGFAGDRVLVGAARAWLAARDGGRAPAAPEAYRLRSADRVEVLFLAPGANPRRLRSLPGRWRVGWAHAVEVTRLNDLAFRTSPSLSRRDAAGWILADPGDGPPVPRAAGREALLRAQEASLAGGVALLERWLLALASAGARKVDVEATLKTTALPRSVRARAARGCGASAPVSAIAARLAAQAARTDREEGECYARAAGRLVLEQAAGARA